MEAEEDLKSHHKRSSREQLISAAIKIGPEMESQVRTILDGEGIGSQKFIGRSLRIARTMADVSQEQWASNLGLTDGSHLSRVERGEYPIPSRSELIVWGMLLGLPQEEVDNLMVSAGYIPETGFEDKISPTEHRVFTEAICELLGKSEQKGFMEMLRNLMKDHKQADT